MQRIISLLLIMAIFVAPILADYKITQQTVLEGMTSETTIWAKGVRERRQSKIKMDDPETAAMMAKMMPDTIEISQCDLKQNVTISDPKKSYFVDYYDWANPTPEQKKRRPVVKMVVKGTSTISSTVTDSGKRQMMFGLEARWLKAVTTIENSADSCEGAANIKLEKEGWFVKLNLAEDTCQSPSVPSTIEGSEMCRPRFIIKAAQDPGFQLEGTTKIYENGKLQGTTNIKTTALSKATLDQALFEIPTNYKEVDSLSELMPGFLDKAVDTSATTVFGKSETKSEVKTIAVDFFSGNASKVNQDELRGYISQKITAAGMSGFPINSQAEISPGRFANVIGVELKKVKESSGAKIGGLFGRVTGNDDAAKLGDSEAEIVITIYGSDGKTVVATANATEKVKGKGNDAVKAAIDKIIGGLLGKIK